MFINAICSYFGTFTKLSGNMIPNCPHSISNAFAISWGLEFCRTITLSMTVDSRATSPTGISAFVYCISPGCCAYCGRKAAASISFALSWHCKSFSASPGFSSFVLSVITIFASQRGMKSILSAIASFAGSNTPASKPRLSVLSVPVYLFDLCSFQGHYRNNLHPPKCFRPYPLPPLHCLQTNQRTILLNRPYPLPAFL